MGCSGTSFHLVDLCAVWPRYVDRVLRLPVQGVIQAIMTEARDDALAFEGPDGLLIIGLSPKDDDLESVVLLAVSRGTPGAFKRQEAAVCAIARDLGSSVVTFIPARRGWGRLLGPEWIMRGKAYVRRLDVR